jgi:hypothetical protein
VVGGVATVAGLRMFDAARRKAEEISLVPEQSVGALRENLSWLRNQADMPPT